MPFRTVTRFFQQWFDRPQGGLGPEKLYLDSIESPEKRKEVYDKFIRIAWRAYCKGRTDGKRGYSEMVVRRKVGYANRKSTKTKEFEIREDE